VDLALFSARVFTAEAKAPWAEAVAIKDGRIAAVGTNREIRDLLAPGTRTLDLPGRLITPGLTDAHMHLSHLGFFLNMVNLAGLRSWEECRARIKAAAAETRPGEWILGWGWNHHLWPDHREPDRHGLDDITPLNPVMMTRTCGHSVVVNTRALEICGLSAQTPDPDNGRLDREADGGLSGLLRNARQLVDAHLPAPDQERLKAVTLEAQAEAIKLGLTGIHTIEKLPEGEALAALDKEGRLKLRTNLLLPPDQVAEAEALGIKPGAGSGRFWFGRCKLFADGSLGASSALLHEPYCDQPDQRGLAYASLEELREGVELAYSHGCDVAIHAIGDKGVTNALAAIEQARQAWPGAWRDRIEHVQLHRPQDLEAFRRLGVVASVQPVFVPTDWSTAEAKWGRERCIHGYAWKTMLEAGLKLQFGSDSPVEPINPVLGLQAAVTRQTCQGEPDGGWFPDQRLTLEESLLGFTQVPAWTARREDLLGSIAPGKLADLTVLDQDLFQLPPREWPSVKVKLTIIGGEIVHQA